MKKAGERRSRTMRSKTSTLYVFKHENGDVWVDDSLVSFAKEIGASSSNLYNTLKYKTRYAADWQLIEVIDWHKMGRLGTFKKILKDHKKFKKSESVDKKLNLSDAEFSELKGRKH